VGQGGAAATPLPACGERVAAKRPGEGGFQQRAAGGESPSPARLRCATAGDLSPRGTPSRSRDGDPVAGRGGARLIRPAQSDDDSILIYQFLCAVAPPVLHCPIAHAKSLAEVRRVVCDRDYGFAYLALEGDSRFGQRLVGTIGTIFVSWWYGDDHFFTDRWFFTLPGRRWAGPRLLAEADAIARAVGVPLIVNLKQRRTTAAVTFVKPALLGKSE